mmetsp:Transcript_32217/g.93066  ORF Transcript_32217/g.93066 Transcript_32217/m.93066 type:complete len:209 (-) Transcript_32217:661-1287(-)
MPHPSCGYEPSRSSPATLDRPSPAASAWAVPCRRQSSEYLVDQGPRTQAAIHEDATTSTSAGSFLVCGIDALDHMLHPRRPLAVDPVALAGTLSATAEQPPPAHHGSTPTDELIVERGPPPFWASSYVSSWRTPQTCEGDHAKHRQPAKQGCAVAIVWRPRRSQAAGTATSSPASPPNEFALDTLPFWHCGTTLGCCGTERNLLAVQG